jgi:hypothetical protein
MVAVVNKPKLPQKSSNTTITGKPLSKGLACFFVKQKNNALH